MTSAYRRLPLLALSAAACLPATARAADRSWTGNTTGDWGTAARWSPAGVPGPADDVRIGDLPGVTGHLVRLDTPADVTSIDLSNTMTFFSNGRTVAVAGSFAVADSSSVRIANAPGLFALDAGQISVSGNGSRFLIEGTSIIVRDRITTADAGWLTFEPATSALVELSGAGTTLRNDGRIHRESGTATIVGINGRLDLDGVTGNGQVYIGGSQEARLTLATEGLTDAFDGEVRLDGNAVFAVQNFEPWTVGAGGVITFRNAQSALASRITGVPLTVAGRIRSENLGGASGLIPATGRIEVSTTFTPSADVLMQTGSTLTLAASADVQGGTFDLTGSGATLQFAGPTTVSGGTFTLAPGAFLSFIAPTTLRGGTFSTASDSPATSNFRFFDAVTYDGNVTFHGLVRHEGDVTISGATTIDADAIDMDGGAPFNTWTVSAPLLLRAEKLDATGTTFDGDLEVSGGTTSKMTVELRNPGDRWTLAGHTRLTGLGVAAFPIDRLAGSPVTVTGGLTIEHRVRVSADVTLAAGSLLTLADAASRLQVTGLTVVHPGATFGTTGTLENGTAGTLNLMDGVDTNGVSVTNRGILSVGNRTGIAAVDTFTSFPSATWIIDVGGYVAGTEHDLLLSTGGPASLAGELVVNLLDLPGGAVGVFRPNVGDEFTVLTSLAGLTGTFANDPVTLVGSTEYRWTVLYPENQVILRLDAVIPEPASAGLLLPAGLLALRRRR